MNAVQRAQQLFSLPGTFVPQIAKQYAAELCQESGTCAEVVITAYAHYAQEVEKLPCPDPAYQIDPGARIWFDHMMKERT